MNIWLKSDMLKRAVSSGPNYKAYCLEYGIYPLLDRIMSSQRLTLSEVLFGQNWTFFTLFGAVTVLQSQSRVVYLHVS